ncbi:MAG TPA: hypothetical protein VGP68_03935 [Gemmataceae bacterium]|nr:hypothetical protein [Gemmataceae bacterium]
MTDDEFLAAFENCSLTKEDWTHAAHVRMAWLYLSTGDSFDGVLTKVRQAIKRFNQTVIKKPDGYHETVTQAFLLLLLAKQRSGPRGEDFATFRTKHPDLFCSKALEKHYSKALLDSPEARQAFVAPDLSPLPEG